MLFFIFDLAFFTVTSGTSGFSVTVSFFADRVFVFSDEDLAVLFPFLTSLVLALPFSKSAADLASASFSSFNKSAFLFQISFQGLRWNYLFFQKQFCKLGKAFHIIFKNFFSP